VAKLLVMEDDIEFAFQLKEVLSEAGHDVEIRYSAQDALEELGRSAYDLLITDVIVYRDNHPIPDGGISLVSRVRNAPETQNLPIIAMTGSYEYRGMKDILQTALSVGASETLKKPIAPPALLSMITRLLEQGPSAASKANS